MTRTFITVAVLSILTLSILPPLSGQSGSVVPSDTSAVDTLAEVVVRGDRYPASANDAGAVSRLLERREIGLIGGRDLGEALQSAANVHVMSYGGALSLQTLSVRGMGSEHSLLLMDGIPVQNVQTGVNDLRLFDAGEVQDVEILPGGGSALYGSDAVGGTILLRSRSVYHSEPSIEISAGIASFHGSRWSARLGGKPLRSLSVSASVRRERSRGNYPFTDARTGAEETRSNQDYTIGGFGLSALWTPSRRWKTRLSVNGTSADQGVPGPFATDETQGGARRNDRRILATAGAEFMSDSGIHLGLSGLIDDSYEKYLDVDGPFPADNYYRVSSYRLAGQAGISRSRGLSVNGGFDIARLGSESNSLDREIFRNLLGLYGGVTIMGPITGDGGIMAGVTPSARLDWTSGHEAMVNPKLGVNSVYHGRRYSLRLHSSLGRSVRVPTLNELHYSGEGGEGNPALRPERSVSFDIGLGGTIGSGEAIRWDVTYYSITLSDRIMWLPTSNNRIWSPVNIAKSVSRGLEFDLKVRLIPGRLEATWNYSIIDAKRVGATDVGVTNYGDQLIYVPLDKGGVSFFIFPFKPAGKSWDISMQVSGIYVGERFTVEDNSESLAAYFLLNASLKASYAVSGLGLDIEYHAGNLAGESYEVIPRYPMPLTTHSIDIGLSRRF